MAETKIPNSEDLFEIYKSQLELVNDINQIIVKNKMDKKFFNTLKKCIEHSTDAIETILYGLEQISAAYSAVSIRSKDLKNLSDTISEYQILMGTIGSMPMKILVGNKLRMILLKKSMKSVFKFIEKLGNFNPIKIIKANISLKTLEPIMESMEIITSPLKKISIGDVIRYRFTIVKYKMLFRKLIRLISYIGNRKLTVFAKAKMSMKLMADTINLIPAIFEVLKNKITLKQIIQYRRTISKLYVLLFGRIYDKIFRRSHSIMNLIEKIGEMNVGTAIRAKINMFMIMKTFQNLNDTLMFINEHMGWLEKTKIQENISRTWALLFGEEYGWVRRNIRNLFNKSTTKKKGAMDVIAGITESLSMIDALKAAAISVSLVVFFKAINIVLKSINMYTGLFGQKRFKAAQKGLGHIYSILFSGAKWRQWRNAKNEGERVSVLSIIQAFKDNEPIFHEGFECIMNIAEAIVGIFRTLSSLNAKQAGKSLIALKIMRFNFNTILRISKFIGTPEYGAAITDATANLELINTFLTKLKSTVDTANAMKIRDVLNMDIIILLAGVAAFEFAGLVWLINKAKLADQDTNQVLTVFDNMGVIMVSLKQATDNAPNIIQAINLNIIIVLATIAIFEFAGMVWLVNKSKLAEQDANNVLRMFDNMSATMISLKKAVDNTPPISGIINMMIVLPMTVVLIMEYNAIMWFIGNYMELNSSEKAQAFFTEMSNTLKNFCIMLKEMPEPKQAIKAVGTLGIVMVVIGGYLLLMSLISTRATQTRKSHRVITSMMGAIGGVVLIIVAMIAAGAMIILGIALIGITLAFIATMLAMMALLSLAGKFLKKGAIALLLIDAAILGMVATLALMAMLAETIDLKQIALTVLIMITTLGAMALMIWGLAQFEKEIMKGMIPMALIIILTGLAAYAMSMIGDVAKETDAGDLLGTSQIMTLVMAELGTMAFVLSKIPKQDLLIGEAALGGIVLILTAAMPAFRMLGEVANMTDAGDLLGTSQIMVLVIGELGLMAAAAGVLLLGPQAVAFALGEVAMLMIAGTTYAAANAMKALAEAVKVMNEAGLTGDPDTVAKELSKKILIPLRALQLSPDGGKEAKGFLGGKKGYEEGSVLYYLNQLGLVDMTKSALKITAIANTVKKIKDICTAAMLVTAMPPIDPSKLTAPVFAIVGKDGNGGVVAALDKVKRRKIRQTKRKAKTIAQVIRILNKIAKRASKLSKFQIPKNYNEQIKQLAEIMGNTVTVMNDTLKEDEVKQLYTNTSSYLTTMLLLKSSVNTMIKIQAKAKDMTVHTIEANGEETLTISWMVGRFLKDISSAGTISPGQVISIIALMKLPYDEFLNTCKSYEGLKFLKLNDEINTPAGYAVDFMAKSIFQNVNGSNLNQRTSAWKQATDDSVKLIKSINTLDISKVDSLKNMMHELYLFSDSIQGNFDKLADVINDKLLTVLEKLTEALDNASNAEFGNGGGGGSNDNNGIPQPTDKDNKKIDKGIKNDVASIKTYIGEIKKATQSLANCVNSKVNSITITETK